MYFSTLCQPEDTSTGAQHRISGGGRLRFWSPKKTALPPVFLLLNGATMKLPLCLDSGKNRRRTADIGSRMEMALAHSSRRANRRIIDRYHNCSFLEVRESEVHPSVPPSSLCTSSKVPEEGTFGSCPPAPCSFPLSSQTVGPLSVETLIRLAQGNHGTPDTSVCGLRYLAQLWPEIPRPRPSQTLADSVSPPAWCPLSPTMFPMSSASQAAR
ncbi:hypothetical protein CTAM01_12839 [Colletotrichum tamarilloi]|uniref:Uncharacterized protein n=1 Tax=Colletotrichum tamarilloi TaxID=1209934 RepID=A0ABQ9QTS0_9PEZI|nr:uncharacterized protein CTAM01_12839 [Colletotrichum tamarilloi]KAK1484750.1 hypothetical protein CTAM01_12839 [Colletotrichum tamarilloi]